MPLVDVIIPCHNAERFLGACLQSVAVQSETRWQAVIVDDASSDGSVSFAAAWCARDARMRLLRLETNRGVCSARNSGAAQTTAPYLLFLDADDLLDPTMLETATRYLDEHDAVSAVHVGHRLVDEDGAGGRPAAGEWPWVRLVPSRWATRALSPGEASTPFCSIYLVAVAVPSLVVMRRQVFEAVGGFDEALGQGCEDTDLFLRLALLGELHSIPDVLVSYRQHATQHSRGTTFADQYAKLLQKWAAMPLSPADRRTVEAAEWFRARRFVPSRQWRAVGGLVRTGALLQAGRVLLTAARGYSAWRPPGQG